MTQLFGNLSHGLLQLFYPHLCEGCRKTLIANEQVLCMSCELQLPETGYSNIENNETELRFAGRIPFMHGASFAYFVDDGLLQHLMHGLKYRSKKQTGLYLGSLFGQRLLQTQWINHIDAIIPVPLHPAKEAERGYNQSLLIAEGMAKQINKPVVKDLLIRNRKTESQTKKTRNERVDNMAGAFSISRRGALTGLHILLCDDVLTTGATLEACAQALMTEESVKISMATIGIAVS